MKLRKLLLVLGLCLAMILTFTACDDESDSGEEDVSEDTVEEEVVEDEGSDDAAADFSAIEGAWTVGGLIASDGEYYDLADVGIVGLDASSLEASIEFDGSGNLTYAAAGQSMGGTSTFDGETINVTFENGYEMAFTYDADNDALMQSNESAGVTVVYYRA